MGVSLSDVFMVCLQTLLLRNYFGKRNQLFAHPTSNYCEFSQLKCLTEGANAMNLLTSPPLPST